jgi:hypothetical protein
MPYLGNTPTTQSFISGTDYFNGTGAQTAFTLSRTVASVNDIQAVVNNVVQVPNDAYTISGTTITFTSAPSAGTQNVYVRYLSTTTQAITPSQNTVSWNTLDSNVQGDLGISFKNRIINGAMVISQRGTSTVTIDQTGGTYTLDRWYGRDDSDGAYSIQQVSDAPTGFTNSLKITITTTDSSLSASQYGFIGQWIEGYNIADLGFGTASAKTVTLSFWVKGSVTGQFGGSITNSAQDRSYPFNYTISAANTWEQKTVTITGDTTGTWLTTNGAGIGVIFAVGVGSNFLSTANTWIGSFEMSATGQTNLYATSGGTLQFTGVQLEVGTQATTFTTAGGSYGAELVLCQRYFYMHATGNGVAIMNGTYYSSSQIRGVVQFPVSMRTAPTLFSSTGSNYYSMEYTGGDSFNSFTIYRNQPNCAIIYNDTQASGTAGFAGTIGTDNASAYVGFTAEL